MRRTQRSLALQTCYSRVSTFEATSRIGTCPFADTALEVVPDLAVGDEQD